MHIGLHVDIHNFLVIFLLSAFSNIMISRLGEGGRSLKIPQKRVRIGEKYVKKCDNEGGGSGNPKKCVRSYLNSP